MSDTVSAWQMRIHEAQASGTPLRIRGAGTKDFYGTCVGDVLDTRAHTGIVSYEPTELVVTVRAGTPWAELVRALDERQQCLPFEPPFVAQGATVGGVVNAGLTGAARLYVGGIRDYVLGAHLLNAQGELLKLGGQVMKNVAGYDLSRLLVGSRGTLGLMTQVSLKVLPQPKAVLTLRLSCDFRSAQVLCRRFLVKPIAVTGSAWLNGVLTVRLAGMAAAVSAGVVMLDGWAYECVGGSFARVDEAEAVAFWGALQEQSLPYFSARPSDEHALWRAVLPTAVDGLTVHADTGLAMWGGALRWLWAVEDLSMPFKAAGGHATCYRTPLSGRVYPTALAASNEQRVQAALKMQFDPKHIFNRHRFDTVTHAGHATVEMHHVP
ncbi:glycolate oxidase subunit GlcE [Ephemeroptericola cinctiostellae]|nr:glycolate oxidase subunit GlcE [Ephemeroptericola cinctiostellae]